MAFTLRRCGIGPEAGGECQSSEASAKAKELLDPVNNELKAAAEAANQHQRLEYGEARPASVEMAMRALLFWWREWAGSNRSRYVLVSGRREDLDTLSNNANF